MSGNIGTWAHKVTMDAANFTRGADSLVNSAARTASAVNNAFNSIKLKTPDTKGFDGLFEGMFGRIGGAVRMGAGLTLGFESFGLAAGLAIGKKLIEGISQTVGDFENFDALNDQLGTSIVFLSSLRTVAGEAGVDANVFTSAMERMNVTIGAAIQGSAEARGVFDRLGVSWDTLARGDRNQSLLRVAAAFSEIENRAERARLSADLFGRGGGAAMMRIMNADLGANLADASSRGGAISPAQREAMLEIDRSLDRVSTQWGNAWRSFVASTAPAITGFFATWEQATRRIYDSWARMNPGRPSYQAGPPAPPQISTAIVPTSMEGIETGMEGLRERQRVFTARVETARQQALDARARANLAASQDRPFANRQSSGLWAMFGFGDRSVANRAAAQRAADADNMLISQRNQLARITASLVAHERAYSDALKAGKAQALAALKASNEAERKDYEARKRRDADEAARITAQMATPMELYAERIRRLNELLLKGAMGGPLGQQAYNRARLDAIAQLERSLPQMPQRSQLGSYEIGSAAASSLANQNAADDRERQELQTIEGHMRRLATLFESADKRAQQSLEQERLQTEALNRLGRGPKPFGIMQPGGPA